MLVLGIETSCDDTATAAVEDGRRVLSRVSTNQDAFHVKYGGIVPVASRQHVALLSGSDRRRDRIARGRTLQASVRSR
jgi:N6-L-threonylcarbamoyladenine synthase